MGHKIEDILKEPKFELIIFYFKEHGILTFSQLNEFDFSELLFVPGISEADIADTKAAIENYKHPLPTNNDAQSLDTEFTKNDALSAEPDAECLEQAAMVIADAAENKLQHAPPHDALITKVYQGKPRCNPFVRYCAERRKEFMSQLDEEDFKNARELKGLGKSSVDTLRQVWLNFMQTPSEPQQNTGIHEEDAPDIDSIFGYLPHGSAFIRYCQSKNWTNLSHLSAFSFDAAEVRGVGPTTMQKFHQVYLDKLSSNENHISTQVFPESVAEDNMNLPIGILHLLNVSDDTIAALKEAKISTVGDFCRTGTSPRLYLQLREAVILLGKPVTNIFADSLHNLKDSAYQCLLRKAQGDTLQAVADEMGITRERVRQINARSCRILDKYASAAVMVLREDGEICFNGDNLATLFQDPEAAACCKFVLIEGKEYTYIKSLDKFVYSSAFDGDISEAMERYICDVIGAGLNFYEALEDIENQLSKYNLGFFDFEDVMKFLVGNGYHFYGDYVVKGRGSYAKVCYDAVLKYFPFDIKLNDDSDNEDIKKLRGIIERRYSGIVLPEGNRALCARLASCMILSDRGRYCPSEKIIYSADLMNDIYQYIQDSPQTTFYYTELFSSYQGRLYAETNITNPYFLHGVLKYLHPNDFSFERDLLVKSGSKRQDINERLCELLATHGEPMSKAEILQAIPGLNDFVLAFAVARIPKLIQWEYGYYNHIDNTIVSDKDIEVLQHIIAEELQHFSGYLSEDMLYRCTCRDYPVFLQKNNIKSPQNLYYICAFLFRDQYRFRRPHILSAGFPVQELTIENIARVLLGSKRILNYSKFMELAEKLGWAGGTFYSVFCELEKDYIRVSLDDYIAKDAFSPSEDFLDNTAAQIARYVNDSGYFAISAIFNYDNFPDCGMAWNGFLLQSLIEEYSLGYKIIAPQIKDRRYQRGIIIQSDSAEKTFEDLVLSLFHKEGISSLSEMGMEKYLRNRGLVAKAIPQELYDCASLQFKNDVFVVK